MNYDFKEQDAWDFAKHIGQQPKKHGDELNFKLCPYCRGGKNHDKDTFSINLKTGQFKCLRDSCGIVGNMITLSKDFNFDLGGEIGEYIQPKKQYRRLKTPDQPIVPKPNAIAYMKSRGISEEICRRYELTVQTDHDNILVFPFYDPAGNLQFVKYRKTDFDKERDKNKEWCEPNCRPILFGMKQCVDFGTLVVTEGQCFDSDAEIMTPDGWIKLESYAGQTVLQINENLSASFVRPKQYVVKRHIGEMISVSIGGNYYTCITDNHNIVLQKPNGDLIKKYAKEKIPTNYHIPTAVYHNSNGFKWDNEMIALCLAISADGTLDYRSNGEIYARFGLTKQRKIERLLRILKQLEIKYSDSILTQSNKEYHSICFTVPKYIQSKYLPWEFATKTTLKQKRFIIEEMVHWDGNRVNNRNQYEYMSIVKHNADVIQSVASMCGYMSTIRKKESGGNGDFRKGYVWKVSVLLMKKNISTQQYEKHKEKISVDQMVYCVTVPSGMILVRQKDKISVSGNCDSLSISEAGIPNAVSVPTGAKGFTWIPYCWDWVRQFEEIVVFGDYEKGHMTLLDDIKARFPNKIRAVQTKDYLGCKDANEILQKHGKEAVRKAIENAKLLPVNRVIKLSDVKSEDLSKLPRLKTGIKNLDVLLAGGLFFGQVDIIAGKRGDGKSTLVSEFVARAIEQGYTVFVYSGELLASQYKRWMDLQIAGSKNIVENYNIEGIPNRFITNSVQEKINNWYDEKVYIYDNTIVDDEEEDLLKTIQESIMQYGIEIVVIDNLMTAIDLDNDKDQDKYNKQSRFVKKLTKIALRYKVLILLVAHRRKNGFSNDANDEVSGSADITNLAGIVMSYDRDKELPQDQRRLVVSKSRLIGKLNFEGFILQYDDKSKRIFSSQDELEYCYGWEKDEFISTSDGEVVFV